ncbi:MAG: type II secretion system protein GspG [bacterium]|nr:type II secretion system protein GspG [bacterium]
MQKGITLAELVIVLLIIGILAAVILPVITAKTTEARYIQGIADLDAIKTAIASYQSDIGMYPPSDAGFNGCALMRKSLVVGLAPGNPLWKGPYLDMKLERTDTTGNILDSWNNPYVYVAFADYTAASPFYVGQVGTGATYGPDTGGFFNPNTYQIFSKGMNGYTLETVSSDGTTGRRGTDADDINNWYGDERKRH